MYMIRRSLGNFKEKIDSYINNLIDGLLILVSIEPYWKREEPEGSASAQTAPTEDTEDDYVTMIMMDSEDNSNQDNQIVPCNTAP
jgi:hypothetical protein